MLKPELQAKYLQHLNNRRKKGEEGFTLIELLVVVIIIGVLAAIALPSLLGQVNKAKQAEAKNNVGTVNRAQQAFYLEYQKFASSISELQVGIKSQTENFFYSVVTDGTTGFGLVYAAAANKDALKSYYGAVGTTAGDTATSEALTVAIACESPNPTKAADYASVASIVGASIDNLTACVDSYASLAR